MNCDAARSKLNELADRELDPAAEAALREHLAACAGCHQVHEDLERLKTLVQAKFKKPAPRPTFQCSCLARAYAGEGRTRVRRVAAIAAVLLVGGIAASIVFHVWPSPPKLTHAEASSGCVEAFRQALSRRLAGGEDTNDEGWRSTIGDEIRRATGVSLDRLPDIPNAKYAGWHSETMRGVQGVRIDFVPLRSFDANGVPVPTAVPAVLCRKSLISVFFFPLAQMRFSEAYRKKLEEGHHCTRCIAMKDGSIVCYRSSELLISMVSNLGEDELVRHHSPR